MSFGEFAVCVVLLEPCEGLLQAYMGARLPDVRIQSMKKLVSGGGRCSETEGCSAKGHFPFCEVEDSGFAIAVCALL